MADCILHGAVTGRREQSIPALLEELLTQNLHHVVARASNSDQILTISALKKQSTNVALRIQSSSGPIALYFEPSIPYVVAVVSVVRLGRSYVAIDSQLPIEQQQLMLAQTGATVVLCSSTDPPNHDFPGGTVLEVERLLQEPSQDEYCGWQVSDHRIMCVLYTSGSTNAPKGVEIPYSAVLNRISWQWSMQPFGVDDVVALKTRIGFVDSIAELWAPLFKGTTVVPLPRSLLFDGDKFLKALSDSRVTRITLVPTLLRNLLSCMKAASKPYDSALQAVISSGEELDLDICETFFSCLPTCQIHNYYGSTEVMGDVTSVQLSSIEEARAASYQNRISIGTLITNMSLVLHNCNDQGVGEFFCTGEGLAAGYIGISRESSAKSAFQTAHEFGLKLESADLEVGARIWFRTGDLLCVHKDKLFSCGRRDDMVKIAGIKVDVGEITRTIMASASFETPPVVVYSSLRTKIVAMYRDTEAIDPKAIYERLRLSLPTCALPIMVPIPNFMFRPKSGKTDKRAMLARFESTASNDGFLNYNWNCMQHLGAETLDKLRDFVAILTDMNITAASIGSLLDTNFFAAGGTSLNVMTFVSRLTARGMSVKAEDVFEAESPQHIFEKLVANHDMCGSDSDSDSSIPWTVKPLDKSTIRAAAQSFAANMLDIQPVLYLWENAPDREEARQRCSEDMFLIIQTLEQCFLREPYVSFGVFDQDDAMVGVCCNIASDSPSPEIPSDGSVTKLVEFLAQLESTVISKLQSDGHDGVYMENLISAVDLTRLPDPALRVRCMYVMEQELVNCATIDLV